MRRILAPLALALPLALTAMPALALDRVPLPASAESLVSHVADLDRPMSVRAHAHKADAYWYWRYRAAYTRWVHNEYARAGFPVRHRQFRTYARADVYCCHRYRHW